MSNDFISIRRLLDGSLVLETRIDDVIIRQRYFSYNIEDAKKKFKQYCSELKNV